MTSHTTRRDVLRGAAAAAGAALAPACRSAAAPSEPAASPPTRVIDTHAHVYDPSRPQGVPWPPPNDALLYRTVLPRDIRALVTPRRVDATVIVEASPWQEDNAWVLDLAKDDPFVIGLVGNLPAGQDGFPALLERFAANPLFRGVRVHEPGLKAGIGKDAFREHLKLLAKRGLALDVNHPPARLPDIARLARDVPDLRIVIDHVSNVRVDGGDPPEAWRRGIAEAGACRNVHCKVSGLVEGSGRTKGDAPADAAFYRKVLDAVWDAFGEDRLIWGSNWPVSARYAAPALVMQVALDFVGTKGAAALEKVFWRNALAIYGCSFRAR